MNSLPSRRWDPGFIAMRWRHGFWGLPLLGLLAGLIVHFLPMIGNTATGIVQIRPGGSVGSIPWTPTSLPLFTPSGVVGTVGSDDILRPTALALDLPAKWRMEEDKCVSELRNAIRCDEIRGTALVEITVRGRNRRESKLIWHALVTTLQEHFEGLRSVHDQSTLAHLEAAVKRQKADVDSKREALSQALKTETLLYYPNGAVPQTNGKFLTLKDDFETSQKLLEQLQIKEISEKMQARITEDPLIIHQAPGTPVPVTFWDTLRPLVLHSSIGLGAGMVLAVVLAYLLELLFPRKSPTL